MATNTLLTEETVQTVQALIKVNLDSRDGLKEAADHVEDSSVAELFREVAARRDRQATELRGLVKLDDDQPQTAGSLAAAAHRAWMDLRAAFGAGTQAMLDEAERGEDHIKEQYDKALRQPVGNEVMAVLKRQYQDVKSAHDRVRDLRDSYSG